ncbi:hypothetical protein FO519_001537 [Halicephalobus sp. NKZ332]|nr:hypothetical protein FO519_001537 [Halicephalobus sp. NKZ332]
MEALFAAKDDISSFLVALMAIESTTTKEGALSIAIKEFLKSQGFHIIVQPIPQQANRFNILATVTPFEAPGPRILFNTHLDTVPPFIPPRKDDEKIYGRGSNDAKGQIASQIFALMKLVKEQPQIAGQLGLLLVVGEETDHIGMKEANKFILKPDYLIVGEPTDMKFASIQKGAVKLSLVAKGVAAHSGYPHLGESAIEKLLDVLQDIRRYKWPSDPNLGDTTLNIGFISGGQALNALAEKATADIFVRVTHSAKEVYETVKKIADNRVQVDLHGNNEPVILTKPPPPYETHPVSFNTDIPYFDSRNSLKGCFLFGPGSITNAHSQNEFIPIRELEDSVDILVDLVKKLSKR